MFNLAYYPGMGNKKTSILIAIIVIEVVGVSQERSDGSTQAYKPLTFEGPNSSMKNRLDEVQGTFINKRDTISIDNPEQILQENTIIANIPESANRQREQSKTIKSDEPDDLRQELDSDNQSQDDDLAEWVDLGLHEYPVPMLMYNRHSIWYILDIVFNLGFSYFKNFMDNLIDGMCSLVPDLDRLCESIDAFNDSMDVLDNLLQDAGLKNEFQAAHGVVFGLTIWPDNEICPNLTNAIAIAEFAATATDVPTAIGSAPYANALIKAWADCDRTATCTWGSRLLNNVQHYGLNNLPDTLHVRLNNAAKFCYSNSTDLPDYILFRFNNIPKTLANPYKVDEV